MKHTVTGIDPGPGKRDPNVVYLSGPIVLGPNSNVEINAETVIRLAREQGVLVEDDA